MNGRLRFLLTTASAAWRWCSASCYAAVSSGHPHNVKCVTFELITAWHQHTTCRGGSAGRPHVLGVASGCRDQVERYYNFFIGVEVRSCHKQRRAPLQTPAHALATSLSMCAVHGVAQVLHDSRCSWEGNNAEVQLKLYLGCGCPTQIMVFIGFGCLMTFLRRYSYSAIAFNFFVSAFVIVWAILGIGLFQQVMTRVERCAPMCCAGHADTLCADHSAAAICCTTSTPC